MNPLIHFAVVGSATAGLVFWQQASIDRIHKNIARLSDGLVATRKAIDVDRTSLSEARNRLDQLLGDLRKARHEQASAAADEALALTPEREGWWPRDRPYFYLPKSYLPQVRFRKCRLPIAEVNARLTEQAAAMNPSVVSVSRTADKDGKGTLEYRLFEGGKLNRDMAVLLGMDTTETERADELYAGFIRAVHGIEAARIVRVDPPEPADTAVAGQTVVARLPDISDEVTPLLAALNEALNELLGGSRAAVLEQQAEDYFDRYDDKLGTVPRDFIKDGDMLIIQYRERWGKPESLQTIGLPVPRNGDYSHLFGPGAPCELK
jgi:hypothetical protein